MKKIRILAVDDEIRVLNIIKNILRNNEITIETSSYKAAELIRQKEFDIFIVDYQMPEYNGIELLEEIQKEYRNKEYVSIFLTASGTIYLFKEEIRANLFDFFLEKPFEIDDFRKVFDNAVLKLGRKRNKGNK